MTSEHDSTMNEEISRNEEENVLMENTEDKPANETDTKCEDDTADINTDIPVQEKATSEEDEQTDVEKVEPIIHSEEHDLSVTSESSLQNNGTETQPLFEQPIVLSGKRSRKPTSRLELSESTPSKKELYVPQGRGKPLGEIEFINYQITHASIDAVSRLRHVCYGRRGNKTNIRKNLREFKGFEFQRSSNDYQKLLNNLIKFTKEQLKSMSNILGLSTAGRNTDNAERILNFLLEPVDQGKRLPVRKSTKRPSKKHSPVSKESMDIDQMETNEKSDSPKHRSKLDYVYRPGKKLSNKRSSNGQTPTSAKRKKTATNLSDSKENQEIDDVVNKPKYNEEKMKEPDGNDLADIKSIEDCDQNETKLNQIVEQST